MEKQAIQWAMALPAMELLHIEQSTNGDLTIGLETSNTAAQCPHCKSTKVNRYGNMHVRIRDLNFGDHSVYMDIKRSRFKCLDCLSTFKEPIAHISESHRATTRLIDNIKMLSLHTSFRAISKVYNIDEKMVRNIFNESQKGQTAPLNITPPKTVYLWMPTLKRTTRLAWINVDEKTIYDMNEFVSELYLNQTMAKLTQENITATLIAPVNLALITLLVSCTTIPIVLDKQDYENVIADISQAYPNHLQIKKYVELALAFSQSSTTKNYLQLNQQYDVLPKVVQKKLHHLHLVLAVLNGKKVPLFYEMPLSVTAHFNDIEKAINTLFGRRSYELIKNTMLADTQLYKFSRTPKLNTQEKKKLELGYEKFNYGTQLKLLSSKLASIALKLKST